MASFDNKESSRAKKNRIAQRSIHYSYISKAVQDKER